MPLKLWLPLDGTSENRGISGVTMTGSPASWGNGRTGKCATFNNNAGNLFYNTTTEFNYTVEDFSWCIWLNKDFASSTASNTWVFTVGRADVGGRGYGLQASWTTQVQLWFGTSTWYVPCPDNEWHHLAFTRRGAAIRIYRDGVLVTSATFGGTLPTYSDGAGPGIGCFHYGANIYPLKGSVSDFRIYNHALSAKEVYEISRALIVHYPLCAPGNANPNLITWSKNYTKATPYVHSSSATDGYKYMGNDTLVTVTPGKTYYIQLKCDHSPKASHGNTGSVSNNFTFWFYIRNIGTTKSLGQFDDTKCFTSSNILINEPDRNLYVWEWTAPSNAQDVTFRTNTYSDGSTVVTMKFWDFKMEEGTYTAYVPSRNSSQYSALGYDSTVVRDASGRGIDLTYSATGYTHVQGSPRYSTAVDFNQTAYLYNNTMNYALPQFTVAFWLKPSTSSSQHFIFGLFNSWVNDGIGMFRNANSLSYQTGMMSDAESTHATTGGVTYPLNEWSHVAITWDGTKIIVYKNTVVQVTKTYGLSGNCNLHNVYLGNSLFQGHPASETEEAAMSDFRLYGTALSADDVSYLYRTSAAIDFNGDVFAAAFEETESRPRVGKEGLVYGKKVSEAGGSQRLFTGVNGSPVNPNNCAKSFTPTTAQNSTVSWYYFECIPGIQKYHAVIRVDWSGFADISATNPDFDAWFQGTAHKTDGSGNEWAASSFTSALNQNKYLGTLAKSAESGSYLYDIDFTLSSVYPDTYIGQYLGMRSDYSNGTGKFTISNIRIYPADEHTNNSASFCSSGAIQARLADEVHLA